jgi:hypothetical protein
MTAPYRGWHSRNFSKLLNYIAPTLDAQKEHLLALHEDPSYVADTLRDVEGHVYSPRCHKPTTVAGRYHNRTLYLAEVVLESHYLLSGWDELFRRFVAIDQLFQDDSTIHNQIHAVYGVQKIAQWMMDILAQKIAQAAQSAPQIQKHTKQGLQPKDNLTNAQRQMLHYYEGFLNARTLFQIPAVLSWNLESMDRLMRKHPECTTMVSSRILSLLTDFSIIGESLRQIEW